jgi:hypothetical protein
MYNNIYPIVRLLLLRIVVLANIVQIKLFGSKFSIANAFMNFIAGGNLSHPCIQIFGRSGK